MRSKLSVILLAVLLWWSGKPVAATVAVERDFPDLVARAEQIVIGTVIGIREEDDDSGVRRTLVRVGDLSVLKGRVDGDELKLDFVGAQKGAYVSRVLDFPIFREGERAVLFIAENGRAACPLVGVWQGRFRVQTDPQSGLEIVESNDGRRVLGRHKRNLQYAPQQGGGGAALTLDQFRLLIADELAHPTGER